MLANQSAWVFHLMSSSDGCLPYMFDSEMDKSKLIGLTTPGGWAVIGARDPGIASNAIPAAVYAIPGKEFGDSVPL